MPTDNRAEWEMAIHRFCEKWVKQMSPAEITEFSKDHLGIHTAVQKALDAERGRTRLEYQHPMDCGHAKGNLLTCTETEPSGCLACIGLDEREAATWRKAANDLPIATNDIQSTRDYFIRRAKEAAEKRAGSKS